MLGELPPDVMQSIGEHDFGSKVSENQTNSPFEREQRLFPNLKIRALKMQSKLTRSAIRP